MLPNAAFPSEAGSDAEWKTACHGTFWYSLWSVLLAGVLAESGDESKGHEYWEPGVYCSPELRTARDYARPHVLFKDTVFHRVVYDLRVNYEKRRATRNKGGKQWVLNTEDVFVYGVRIQVNSPPLVGEERVLDWDP